MPKTIDQINERIRKGQAVVLTAEEIIDVVDEKGPKKAAEEVDVVTTGTFGPMCSSGAFLNTGHFKPRMKIQRAYLNGVLACAGLAAVDLYLGATEVKEGDPLNSVFPGAFKYGGGHVIEDLVAGKDVELRATAYGTDCYPLKHVETLIRLKDLNEAVLLNPRNAYQNYSVAVNATSSRPIYTYMGILRPQIANANYSTSGQLSPLLNDPRFRTIGIGTRMFLGGATGYVYWQGTQHETTTPRTEGGVPKVASGTLAVCGDLKGMSSDFIRGTSLRGYGVSLSVGIGIPIPILDEEMARYTAVKDEELVACIIDYSEKYPNCIPGNLGEVTYKQLRSGKITVNGKDVPTSALSSLPKARQIAELLKEQIKKGEFELSTPVAPIPTEGSGYKFKPCKVRPLEEAGI